MPRRKSVPPAVKVEDGKKLLTPELQQKIETRVREVLDLSKTIWPDHSAKFDTMPAIMYDVKSRVGGLAYHHEWRIRLNLILCFENEAHFIEQTVGHEVAHLICDAVNGRTKLVDGVVKKIRSHGHEWRGVMTKLGLKPYICHNYDTSSIQSPARKRAKKGSVVQAKELALMLKRLQNGYNRLPQSHRPIFAAWVMLELEKDVEKDTGE
jgi:predicted SprT family Zn-dependent metalloprotease